MDTATTELVGHGVFHKGDRLRKARELTGYPDIRAFADATGMDRGALGRYEATGEIPRRATIKALVMALDIREEWLLAGTGPMRRANTPTPPDTQITKQ